MTSTAEKVKQNILLLDVLSADGIKVNKDNRATCFACNGSRKNSLRIYPETNSYYCFRCNSGGTVVDYLIASRNLTVKQALDILAEHITVVEADVKLVAKEPTYQEWRKIEEEKTKVYVALIDKRNAVRDWLAKNTPQHLDITNLDDDTQAEHAECWLRQLHPKYEEGLNALQYCEYLIELATDTYDGWIWRGVDVDNRDDYKYIKEWIVSGHSTKGILTQRDKKFAK